MSSTHGSTSIGTVRGSYGQETLACQFIDMTNSQGRMWFGEDPFTFTVPLVLSQFIVILVITNMVWLILKPCKQGLLSAQLIGGIILGQSFLGHIDSFRDKLFPPGGRMILQTFADIGFMFYLFILGVQIDVSLVKRIDRYSVLIGMACFLVPLIVGQVSVAILSHIIELHTTEKQSLPFIASLSALSSFPVITSLLVDLNILNSEIGRLATLASLVCDICNYTISLVLGGIVMYAVSQSFTAMWSIVGAVVFFIIIVFLLRPFIIFVADRVPDGQPMKEAHFVLITLVVIISGLGAEVLGQPAALGAFLLGVVVPDGPSLGSLFVNKLYTFTTGLLFPAKIVIGGLHLDIFSIKRGSGATYVLIIIICYSAKFTAVLVPSLYCKLPTKDAVALALIMCCRGVIEIALYITLYDDGIIGSEAYGLLIISMVMVTGIARPLICHLYDPSNRYLAQCKNSIMLNHPTDELRILVCIHNAENVPTILNLLEASAPTRNSPIAVFILNLMELRGQAASVLEPTTRPGRLTATRSWSKHAANAFNTFAVKNSDSVTTRHFTSISPYASMHDDICTLAADQVTNIVILPFHKQWSIDGRVGFHSHSIRMVNQNVMTKAPCSVGILIDRGHVARTSTQFVKGHPMFHICLLFLGGLDDCEALAYCTRFIENQHVTLTLVWIRAWDDVRYGEENMETEMVKQFRVKTIEEERMRFREEVVKDAIETTRVINSMKECGCDVCVVGRYHDPKSAALLGLDEWSEYPELGLIGDMLVTAEFSFSVLVVQQQDLGDRETLQRIGCSFISSARYSDILDASSSFSSQQHHDV